jgi:hypothetical protein
LDVIVDPVNIELKNNKIEGKLFNEQESVELQKEIESKYNNSDTPINKRFGQENEDIRQNAFNYDSPAAQKNVNGVDVRIVEGLVEGKAYSGKRRQTYLLYADGKIAGKFYSLSDAKKVVNFIEANLVKSLPTQEQTPAQQVEQLRVEEQAELKSAIPNADQYLTDGKVDEDKLTDPEDKEVFEEIYDEYDEIISPLLLEAALEDVNKARSVKYWMEPEFGAETRKYPQTGKPNSFVKTEQPSKGNVSASDNIVAYDGNGEIVGSLAISKEGEDKGAFKIVVREDAKRQGWGKKILDEAEKQGIDIVGNIKKNSFTQSGRNLVRNWLESKTKVKSTTAKPKAEPKLKSKVATRLLFKKAVDLFYDISDTEGSAKKRTISAKRRTFMEQNPSIKYIDDNWPNISKQLKEKGLLEKSKGCP